MTTGHLLEDETVIKRATIYIVRYSYFFLVFRVPYTCVAIYIVYKSHVYLGIYFIRSVYSPEP